MVMSKARSWAVLCLLLSGAALGEDEPVKLGPKDGLRLKSMNLLRVSYGCPAPDFSLMSADGRIVTISDFRGKRAVVLTFFMGLG
jgi:hypothetical protein